MNKIIPLLVILALFAGCHASRDVQKLKVTTSTDIKTDIVTHKRDSVASNIVKHDSSISKISEWVDTTLSIPYKQVDFDTTLQGIIVKVPVKFKRETETKDYNNQIENKKEIAVTDVKKDVVESSKTISISKNTETKGQPWAMWLTIGGVFLVILLIAAYFLAKKFKWFL
jgi:hypothetical protein